MKTNKTILAVVAFLFLGATAYAQNARVGINTTTPATTLDVSGKLNTAGTAIDPTDMTGLQAPRITLTELNAKGASLYGTSQKGALIYVTSATAAEITAAASNTQTPNITAEGYYYFDGNGWQKIGSGGGSEVDGVIGNEVLNATTNRGLVRAGTGTNADPYTLGLTAGTTTGQVYTWDGTTWAPATASNIYNADGTLSANRTVAQSDKTLAFTSTATTGTSHFTVDGTTLNLDAVNNRIGIGTNAPSSKLQVVGDVAVGSSTGTINNSIFPANNPTAHSATTVPSTLTFGQTGGANVAYNAVRNGSNSFNNEFLTFSTHEGGVSLGERMRITPSGNVGIGTTAPTSKLEVNGSATNTTAFNAGSGTSINFGNSNLAYTTANAGAFTLTGMKDGGTYTLAVLGATSGTASFTHTGLTFRSVNNGATTASKHTLYTFIVMGTNVYFWMNTNF